MKENAGIIYVTFEPDGHYGFPEPIYNSEWKSPLPKSEIFRLYGSSDCSPYNMGDGWNDEDPDENGDDLFYEYGWSDIYEESYAIVGLDENEISDIFIAVMEDTEAYETVKVGNLKDSDFVEAISEAGGYIIGTGKEVEAQNLLDLASDTDVNPEVVLDVYINLANTKGVGPIGTLESQAEYKEALASRGDIDPKDIEALDSLASAKRISTRK